VTCSVGYLGPDRDSWEDAVGKRAAGAVVDDVARPIEGTRWWWIKIKVLFNHTPVSENIC
jgi:hypothetical protein